MSGWAFVTLGLPVSQGSKKGFVNPKTGRAILVDSAKGLKPWRQAVVASAPAGPCLDGPLAVRLVFTLPRPASARKSETRPCVRPDIEKLTRAVFDSATDAGLWKDDSRVAELRATKTWPGYHPYALEVPGVLFGAVEMTDDDWSLDLTRYVEEALMCHRSAWEQTKGSA